MPKRYAILALTIGLVILGLALSPRRIGLASESKPWKGEYFQNRALAGKPAVTRIDPVISFDFGYNPPIEGWTINQNYSARWTITDDFGTGEYTFAVRADDGVRMYVDNKLVIDEWHDQESGNWHAIVKAMTAGKHTVKVEYYQHEGWAAIYAGYYPGKVATATKVATAGPSPTPAPPTLTTTPRPTRTPSLFGTVGSQPTAQVAPPEGFSGGDGSAGAGATVSPNDVLVEFNVNKLATWQGFPGPALHLGGQSGKYGYVKNRRSKPTFHIQWSLTVLQSGYYDLYVFVPSGQNVTKAASYRVFNNNTLSAPLIVDQSSKPNQWVFLGSYYFAAGTESSQYVYLDNVTPEETGTRNILLDAVRLVYKP